MKKTGFFVLLSLLLWSCENTTMVSSVPSYPVRLEVKITAEHPEFRPDGTFRALTFTERRFPTEALGYAGILVCTTCDEHYCAYDLCCPVCLNPSKPLQMDGWYAKCPTCGEEYDMSYGYATPTKNISKERLRPYHVGVAYDQIIISN